MTEGDGGSGGVGDTGLGVDPSAFEARLRTLHPAPDLPLAEPFSAGLAPLLEALGDADGEVLGSARAMRVLERVGDRYTATVDPDGISAKRTLRTRRIDWDDVTSITVAAQGDMFTREVVGALAGLPLRSVRLIPGLNWLVKKLLRTLAQSIAVRVNRSDDSDPVVVEVDRQRGSSLTFEGLVGIAVLLSHGFTTSVLHEAEARGIPIIRR